MKSVNRREFLQTTAVGAFAISSTLAKAEQKPELSSIRQQVEKQHAENVRRLQQWIRQPSIAAENRGMKEGCELMIQMCREAGFQKAERVPTEGQPGVFATLDAGAAKTVGLYFMYDVKQ